jgi:hypothetical protein
MLQSAYWLSLKANIKTFAQGVTTSSSLGLQDRFDMRGNTREQRAEILNIAIDECDCALQRTGKHGAGRQDIFPTQERNKQSFHD